MDYVLIFGILIVSYLIASLVWKGFEFMFKMVFKTAITLLLTALLAWFLYSTMT